MDHKKKQLIQDIVFMIILVAFMFFMVKGVPALMGGVTDASGNPLQMTVSTVMDAGIQ